MRYRLARLAELADDEKACAALGSEIVRAALKNAVEERAGLKLAQSDSSVVRIVERGEPIPSDLVDDVRATESEGVMRARATWQRNWLNVGVWDRTWGEDYYFPVVKGGPITISRRIAIEAALDDDELAIFRRLVK